MLNRPIVQIATIGFRICERLRLPYRVRMTHKANCMSLGKKSKLPRKPTPPAAAFADPRRAAAPSGSTSRPVRYLELTVEERDRLEPAQALVIDGAGRECFRGLTIAESLEFLTLQRIGLDNDDQRFLKLVLLGDLHEAAQIRFRAT
ncbi:hypothetical protein [Kaistia terrae]|uniref:hypothetical protein n=1 Tax=Kaistia terrae TaxID=537017 RepID=UPI0036D334C0